MRKVAMAVALSGALLVAGAGAAQADYWTSSISNWAAPKDTRDFKDTNPSSGSNTTKWTLTRCNGAMYIDPSTVTFRLYEVIAVLPDKNLGAKAIACNATGSGSASWTSVPSGKTYHFTYTAMNGDTGNYDRLNVGSVRADY